MQRVREAPLRSITSFHLHVGARLAMRAFVPFSALIVVRVGTDAEPEAAISGLALGIAGRGFDAGVAAGLFLSALAIASWASPRLTHGLTGWLRHLPAAAATHRRGAVLGLAAAQIPILLAVLLLAAGLAWAGGPGEISPVKLLGLPLLALGAATAALPVQRPLVTRAAGTGAALLGVLGDAWGLAMGAVLLLGADRFGGALEARHRVAFRIRAPGAERLPALISLRALGWRSVAAFPVALLPLAAAAFFLANNRLRPVDAAMAARLGGGIAAAACLAGLAQTLAVRRPAWPWIRSLPWTARRRVVTDALLLGSLAAPFVAAAALLRWEAALIILAVMPLLALRAAAAIRTSPAARTGVAGRVLLEGSLASALVALVPWLALAALALVPMALRDAEECERRQKASRWSAAHHLAAGDPLSWSAR